MKKFVRLSATLLAFGLHGVSAQTVTNWTGGGSGSNWNTSGNWDNAVPHTTNGIAQFNASTAKTPNISGNTSTGQLVFTGSSDAESFTGSRTLTLNGVGGLGIDNQTSLTHTFANKFALGASQTWQSTVNGGGLTFNGTVNLAGFNLTLSLASSGSSTVTLGGNISGTASGLTLVGNGTVILTATGSYTGDTTINSGATLQYSGSGGLSNASTVVVNAGGTYNLNGVSDTISSVTGAGNLTLGSAILTLRSSSDTTFAGVISGSGGLTKNTGTGTLTLSGASSYDGTTNINAGAVRIQNATALGSSTGGTVVTSGEALEIDGTGGALSVAGEALTLTGTGMSSGGALRNIGGANTWTGSVTLSGATRINSDAGTLTVAGGIGGTQNLTVGGAGDTAITGAIATGSRSLTKDGLGTLTLGGANTFTGNISVSAGTLVATSDGALGGGSGSTSVASGAALHVGTGGLAIGEQLTLSGTGVGGTGALRNIDSSGTNVLSGAISLAADARIAADSGGTLALSGGISGNGRDLTVDAAGTVSISGAIGTTSGGLTKEGAGTLILASPTGNSFSGATVINAGTLSTAVSYQFGSSNSVTVNSGATLSLDDLFQTVGTLFGTGTLNLGASGSGQLTLSSGTSTFAGTFGGSGTIVIASGATLTLGANFNAPNVNLILAGGRLNLNGTTSMFGALHVTGTSTLDFGNSTASTLSVNNVTFQNTGLQLTVQNWVDLTDYFYSANFTGAVPDTRGSTPQNQIAFNGFSNLNTTWQSFDRQITPTPEPSTYGAWLLSISLATVIWRRRCRSPRASASETTCPSHEST